MRRLMLLRHAKSDWSSDGQGDIDRPLAPRGRAVALRMGRYMAQHGLTPDRVLVSNAQRTRETWVLVAPAFAQTPASHSEPRLYGAGPKALLDVIHETLPDTHTLLLVGHNPGLQDLAGLMTVSGDDDARYRLQGKFPTAALAVIDFATDDWREANASTGRLDRFVTPQLLRLEAE